MKLKIAVGGSYQVNYPLTDSFSFVRVIMLHGEWAVCINLLFPDAEPYACYIDELSQITSLDTLIPSFNNNAVVALKEPV